MNPQTTQELIQAINTANAQGGHHIITLRENYVYFFSDVEHYVNDYDQSALPEITANITMIGKHTRFIRLLNTNNMRILSIAPGAQVFIQGVHFYGGKLFISPEDVQPHIGLVGGGIKNHGSLALTGCQFISNSASLNGYGGAIINGDNNVNAILIVERCQFIANHAHTRGGAILNTPNAVMAIHKSIFRDNSVVTEGGGAIASGSHMTITLSDFAGNRSAVGPGSAIRVSSGRARIQSSAILTNRGPNSIYVEDFGGVESVDLTRNSIYANKATVNNVVQNDHSSIVVQAQHNWWGASDGPSGAGSGSGDSVSTNVAYFPFKQSDASNDEGPGGCGANDTAESSNPISLRLGEKRLRETDLVVNAPAEPLAFERVYRQSKQTDPAFALMGLGWSHNHHVVLDHDGDVITVLLPEGGTAQFHLQAPGYYQGAQGSTTGIVEDTGSSSARYTLTAADKRAFVFDADGDLRQIVWPGGETWTYSYDTSTPKRLEDVSDDYGNQLVFAYLDNPEYEHNSTPTAYEQDYLLWRVGDHTTSNLSGTPTGRYIEFSYEPERRDGDTIADAHALLAEVLDVRGETWAYSYYGQSAGETDDADLNNRFVERRSPSVDSDGDGVADGELILEQLAYDDYEAELAVNGDMEEDSDWTDIEDFEPDVNQQTTEAESGTYARYVEADEDHGIEGSPWNLIAGRTYTITARVYPISGTVRMQVTDEAAFDDVSSGTGAWQTLTATHTPSATSFQHRLQFVANSTTATFRVDNVSIQETVAEIGQITQKRGIVGMQPALAETTILFGFNGAEQTLETVAGGSTIRHQFARGLSAGAQQPDGSRTEQGTTPAYRFSRQTDGNGNTTWLDWSEDGKHLQSVVDAAGHESLFQYDGLDRLTASVDAEGKRSLYFYDGDQRQPEQVLITDGQNLVDDGDMDEASAWENISGNEPAVNALRPLVDAGRGSRYIRADNADEGIEGEVWDMVSGRSYTITARVYPIFGTVKMQVTGTSAFDATTVANGDWETLQVVDYVPGSTLTDRRLQFIAGGGPADFYVDSVSIEETDTETVELAVNGEMDVDGGWQDISGDEPTVHEHSAHQVDSGQSARYVVTLGAGDGIESSAWTLEEDVNYVILARVRPVSGSVKMQVTGMSSFDAVSASGTGEWETLQVVHKATAMEAGGVTLQFIANGAAAEFYLDRVYVLDEAILQIWQAYTYDAKDRVLTEQRIDPLDGSTVLQETVRTYHSSGNGEGLLHTVTQTDIGGADDVTTTYSYDPFGRVVKTQQSSNFGACDIAYTVFDEAGNVVASICNYDPGMSADPTDVAEAVALYDEQEPDKNRVTTHGYDALGRRVKTTINAGATFAQTTLTLYDALDRVLRTITNFVDDNYDAPGDWVFESGVWKDAPAGTTISHGTDNTDNIITDTAYNARGRVRLRRDVLGNVTLLGYDDVGRLVKTIQNASDPDYNNDYNGTSPDPDLSDYSPVSDADQDIISEQVYDAAGNLVQTIDPLGRVSFTAYDALNRPVQVVRNAKDEATIALEFDDEGYDETDDPRSANYEPSSDPGRDQIETTRYDALGRVFRSQRLLENRGDSEIWDTTLYGYDTLGRQVRTVRSASNANYDVAADPDLSEYMPSGEPDEDILTQTVYDDNGRTLYTQDALEVRTWLGYDGLGRGVKTIQSAVGTDTDGGSGDPRSASYSPSSEPDEDLITHTVYNDDGRVQETEDVLGNVTYFVYDTVGRQVRTIRNYVAQGATDPADWAWSVANDRWEDGASNAIAHGTDNDENIITESVYDAQGRVSSTFDHRHNETRFEYDILGRRVKTIQNYDDGTFSAGTPDEDLVSTTDYDVAGRVIATTDNAGIETRFEYDQLGRRVKTIRNYVDGAFSSANPDEDLISTTVYNKAGQVVSTADPRGTQTAFAYDDAGRRLTVTQAAGTSLETVSYTCYDKAGRVLRTIQHWIDDETSPDAWDGSGDWLFAPRKHGQYDDENLITVYKYDTASRRETVIDPVGNETTTAYDPSGQVVTVTDAEGVTTVYRYDKARRRILVVQNFADNGEDPALWVWDGLTDDRWEESDGTAIVHGSDNDQNIIVQVEYDKAGRMLSLRDPNGHETTYAYDDLGRRLSLTNPLSIAWETAYSNLAGGGTRTTQTLPGINGGSTYNVTRDFDRLGRLSSIQYGDPSNTPDIAFGYDAAGNRVQMTEYGGAGFTSPVRETTYGFDDVRRLTSVGFDHDADSSVDETVSYEYDASGLRTKLTLPGGTDSIVYVYNARGELVSLTDWDDQETRFAYDNAGRHIATLRANGLRSRYRYDPASRLRSLRHTNGQRVLGHFAYQVDGRGNRTQALELLPHPATTNDVTLNWDDEGVVYQGSWTDDNTNGFKESTSISAKMQTLFFGNTATLTFGVGPDHGLFDVYIGKTLWQSFDGYAASAGSQTVDIPLDAAGGNRLAHEGPHLFEIRNRVDRNGASSGNKVRFKQLVMADVGYDLHTIQYGYDGLSRLLSADLYPGSNLSATPLREYAYSYDLAGNRLSESLALNGGAPSVTSYTYNAANQITSDGTNSFTYDNNGNLTDDGVNEYAWDRANRLLEVDNGTPAELTAYAYDGVGDRISQAIGTTSPVVMQYLLDTQPGLAKVIAATTGANTGRYVHAPRGIHAMQENGGNWTWAVQDALGSVRSEVDNLLAVQGSRQLTPYLTPFDEVGSFAMPFVGTGEMRDPITGLQYHRARYLNPAFGGWLSLDPFEGTAQRPMSLNGYSWVEGNTPNMVDPSGMIGRGDPYSCHCGWLDWGHQERFDERGFEIVEDIMYIVGTALPDRWANASHLDQERFLWKIGVLGPVYQNYTTGQFEAAVKIIPHEDRDLERRLAVSIFKAAAWLDEEAQGYPIISALGSSFSEEDLISDFLGFYAGYQRRITGQTSEVLREEIRQLCGEFSKEASENIYDVYYPNGVPIGWKEWYPRLVAMSQCDLNIDLSKEKYQAAKDCFSKPRAFPAKFAQLLNDTIPSMPYSGIWWEFRDAPFFGYDFVQEETNRISLIYRRTP